MQNDHARLDDYVRGVCILMRAPVSNSELNAFLVKINEPVAYVEAARQALYARAGRGRIGLLGAKSSRTNDGDDADQHRRHEPE